MICEEFKERVLQDGHYTHYCELEGQHLWSMIFTSSEGESCAVNGTDEEVAFLLTDDSVANSFVMIGESAKEWLDYEKRNPLIESALQKIKERDESK